MSRKARKNKLFFLTLLGGVLCAGLTCAVVFGETATEKENDETDRHAGGPHDIIACNGVQEDLNAPTGTFNNAFPPMQVDTEIDWSDQEIDVTDTWITGRDFNELLNEMFMRAPLPSVDVSLNPAAPKAGEMVTAAAVTQMLETTKDNATDFYHAWSLDGISMNGVVAGGVPLDLQPSNLRDSCTAITRVPLIDEDGDGMDDDWERRYFVDRGLFATIEEVLPNDDYDRDGYAPTDLVNLQGESLILIPPLFSAAGGLLSNTDSLLTNLEEYIWGTDPTDPDTDDDGYKDGEDIAGLGQTTLEFFPTKGVNEFPRHQVRVTVGGIAFQTLTTGGEEEEEDESNGEPLVKIDSAVKEVMISTGEHLEGNLSISPEIAAPGDLITLTFIPSNTKSDPGGLTYQWRFNNVVRENGLASPEIFDYHIPFDAEPGSEIPIEVEVVNPVIGQITTLRTAYYVAYPLTLIPVQTELVPGASVTVNAEILSGVGPSNFLFKWFVDNTLNETASGVGIDSITFKIDKEIGDRIDLHLELFDITDSRKVGKTSIQLPIVGPRLEMSFVPEIAQTGDTITAVVEAVNFPLNLDTNQDGMNDAAQIEYTFKLNGDVIDSEINAAGVASLTFVAGETDTIYNIEATAKGMGTAFQYADALGVYQVGQGELVPEISMFNRFTASLLQNPEKMIIPVVIIGLFTVIIFFIFRSMMPHFSKKQPL